MSLLFSWVALNVLIAVAVLTLGLLAGAGAALKRRLTYSSELRLHYILLVVIGAAVLLRPLIPRSSIFVPIKKSFESHAISVPVSETLSAVSAVTARAGAFSESAIPLNPWTLLLAAVAFGIFLKWIGDVQKLRRMVDRSYVIRRVGRVSILAGGDFGIPFSFWLPFRAYILIPQRMLGNSSAARMAIAHELQHHRQGDTKWIHALWFLRALCFANPVFYFWNRRIADVQELACDETLINTKKVERRNYALELLAVAESAQNAFASRSSVCATGMVLWNGREQLKRRIESMLKPRKASSVYLDRVFAGVLTILIAGTVWAGRSLESQDRVITMAHAREMAGRTDGDFPVVVNTEVLRQLNRYLGTPEGREYFRKALKNRETYRGIVESKIKEYGLPDELAAVPIVESGYENLPPSSKKGVGAGIWMFIPSTAMAYGLRVEDGTDERLQPLLETDAAMRLLGADRLRFRDWQLALLAYNAGENAVQRSIDKTGSRDAWVLLRNGLKTDKDYLPKVMAAVLVMKNPSSLD